MSNILTSKQLRKVCSQQYVDGMNYEATSRDKYSVQYSKDISFRCVTWVQAMNWCDNNFQTSNN